MLLTEQTDYDSEFKACCPNGSATGMATVAVASPPLGVLLPITTLAIALFALNGVQLKPSWPN